MLSNRVYAIVVSFNPNLATLGQLLKELKHQKCGVLIVDNASDNVDQIRALAEQIGSVDLLALESNLGLGVAHNKGIEHARSEDADYVLIMDQDSVPMANMVDELVLVHQYNSKKISSGSLIALETLDHVGVMDEGLFIDHVDTEWFLRARSKGYKAFGSCKAIMGHGLGENTHQVNIGGRKRNVPQHKPFRYYYIFRNSILLYKRRYASTLWKWNDIQRLGMIFIMFGFIVGPRRENLSMMLKGIFHGVIGKQGAQHEH